jgi:hypothetical protein
MSFQKERKTKMNKQQRHSIHLIKTNVAILKKIAEQEQRNGISQNRKRAIEAFYSSVILHAQKLALDVPPLSTFYNPEEYVANCDTIIRQIEERYGGKTGEASPTQSGKNTRLTYGYRDASGSGQSEEIILAGELSFQRDIQPYLYEHEFFIPDQVGLANLQGRFEDFPNEDDHPWHTIGEVSLTDEAPTVQMTADEIRQLFRSVRWDAGRDVTARHVRHLYQRQSSTRTPLNERATRC